MTDSTDDLKATINFNDVTLQANAGGDCHQTSDNRQDSLTTQNGCPIGDDHNSLKSGSLGPTLLEDFILREKLFHFDHERIPERVVHARGYGAHGFFETYDSLSDITKAQLFQNRNQKTPVFVRFSTVAGNKGSADLARDVRGFAVKFYTEEGNWDLVGNNIPVFFIQDAIKFPDLIHAAKQEPDRGFPQAQTAHDNFWDFISLTPESMHMIMWIMSDRTIPRSLRFMEGFGVHTFRLINQQGKSTFVKFHWKPKLGMQSVLWQEAVKINGVDPDFHRRDLWNAIQAGNFPEWELGLQLFDEEFCKQFEFDVLDPTKLIPEEQVPIKMVGRLVLDKCVDNFFAETEQVAYCTQNIIPGIDFSDDPLLQGRNFSYLDTQLKRLGSTNFNQLPINAPRCPFAHFQQDGHMTFTNPKGRANYNPNSWNLGPRENLLKGFKTYPRENSGIAVRERSETFADHYSQARQFYKSQTTIEQKHIIDALVFELSKVETSSIRERMVAHLLNIDNQLAEKVGQGLGLEFLPKACQTIRPIQDLKISPKLSILDNIPQDFGGRRVGILLSETIDSAIWTNLVEALTHHKIDYTIICSQIAGVTLDNGKKIKAHEKIGGAPSVLFDAIIILTSDVSFLSCNTVKEFIRDAYQHAKYIGYTKAIKSSLEVIVEKIDQGCLELDKINAFDFINQCKALRYWQRIS